jgi:hypothetical protein
LESYCLVTKGISWKCTCVNFGLLVFIYSLSYIVFLIL